MIQPPCQTLAIVGNAAGAVAAPVLSGPAVRERTAGEVGPCGASPGRTTKRRENATSWRARFAVFALMAIAGSVDVRAQAPQPVDAPLPSLTASIEPPDAAGSLAAFGQVREWVLAMEAPEKAPAGMIAPSAASVTLRLLGEVIGRGVDLSGGEGAVWRAAKEAIADAERKLPVSQDVLTKDRLKGLATQMTLTVELAGAMAPLREATYDEIDEAISPGVYGLAARVGDRTRAIFPSSAVTTGILPGSAAAALAGEALGDPSKALRVDPEGQPGKLAARDGVRFYKFAVSAVGQAAPSDPGVFLTRGGREVSVSQITQENLKAMGRGIAANLTLRLDARSTADHAFSGIGGTYNPLRGKHDPEVAPPAEQAAVALALASWGAYEARPATTRDAAASMLAGFVAKGTRVDPARDAKAAMLAIAAVKVARESGIIAPDDAALAPIDKAMREGQDASVAGLIALALSATPAGQPLASRVLETMYLPDPKGRQADLATHAPWVVMAERNMGSGKVRPEAVSAMRAFREKAYGYVLTDRDAGAENTDLVGGVVFPGSRPPLPTAQSLRVIAGLAILLADPRVTPRNEFDRELMRFLPCLRFVRQLCADEWTEAMSREPSKTRWGVRAAAWDPRMPGEASALALVTVRETLAALERTDK